jgi:chromosome segregation ATPase
VVLTSHGADRSAITMATLREQLALKRQQLDDEKRLLADSQAQEQKLAAEKTAYLEYEERLRQELAGLENELLDVRSEMTTSKANVEQLVQERTAWDPKYLA